MMNKFIAEYDASDYEILTPTGFQPLGQIFETVPFECWNLETENGKCITVADTHIFINQYGDEVYCEDLFEGDEIQTIDGIEIIKHIAPTLRYEHMYDVSVMDNNHLYYTNGIVSHNTTTTMAYLLHQAITRKNITIAILANKGETAKEVLDRIKFAYEELPWFVQVGVREWNARSVKFDNGSRILSASTSSSSIRGKSCVAGVTKVTVEVDGDCYFSEIENLPNMLKSAKHYCIYLTRNKANGREYIGFHGCSHEPLAYNDNGSIFSDGYLGSGKLIRRAIEKYGSESFEQELIEIFDDKDDALALEAKLVNEEWVGFEHTYNLVLGGRTPILCGSSNGFYGKQHSEKTRKMLSEVCMNNKFHSNYYDNKIVDVKNNITYLDYPEFRKVTGLCYSQLYRGIGLGEYRYSDPDKQARAIKRFESRYYPNGIPKSKDKLSRLAKERFTNVPKTAEHKANISRGVSLWISRNKESHNVRMMSINTNPEKIKKTANTHRGMKRSEEARRKMSLAKKGRYIPHNKGKIRITDGTTIAYIHRDEAIPDGWYRK